MSRFSTASWAISAAVHLVALLLVAVSSTARPIDPAEISGNQRVIDARFAEARRATAKPQRSVSQQVDTEVTLTRLSREPRVDNAARPYGMPDTEAIEPAAEPNTGAHAAASIPAPQPLDLATDETAVSEHSRPSLRSRLSVPARLRNPAEDGAPNTPSTRRQSPIERPPEVMSSAMTTLPQPRPLGHSRAMADLSEPNPVEADLQPEPKPVEHVVELEVDTSSVAVTPQSLGTKHDEPAKPLSHPSPVYPSAAVQQRQEGLVVLRVTVDASGRVTRIEVVRSSSHRLLDESARAAVRNWQFEPARRDGRPVEWTAQLPVRFRLNGKP